MKVIETLVALKTVINAHIADIKFRDGGRYRSVASIDGEIVGLMKSLVFIDHAIAMRSRDLMEQIVATGSETGDRK